MSALPELSTPDLHYPFASKAPVVRLLTSESASNPFALINIIPQGLK